MHKTFPLLVFAVVLAAPDGAQSQDLLRTVRSAPGDLEVGGELAGLPAGTTRYVRYEDLLKLPQEKYTISDDTNFPQKTEISGIPLATLTKLFGQTPDSDLVVAICYDRYRTNYSRAYMAAHHPLLVLRVNGQRRDKWPVSENGGPMGPYMISHPFFKPAFKVLSHEDEAQIPFGITRIELRREAAVFEAIRPRPEFGKDKAVQQGYAIAREDCFRCHNMGTEGGRMAHRSWMDLAGIAAGNGPRFKQMVRDPASVKPGARMPAHTNYDDATLDALASYFRTFSRTGQRE